MRLSAFAAALLLTAVGGAPLSAQFTPAAAPLPTKLGYVNSAAILDEAPGAKEANDQFNKEMQGYQAEIQKMSDDLQTLMDQYERQQLTLSASAKSTRQEEIRKKQQDYQTRSSELESTASKRQQELVQPVMDKVTAVIQTLQKEGNYAIIFDVAGQSIIAADPALDLTAEVVRRLKATTTTTSRPPR